MKHLALAALLVWTACGSEKYISLEDGTTCPLASVPDGISGKHVTVEGNPRTAGSKDLAPCKLVEVGGGAK